MPMDTESESVKTYLPIIQGVISRMANNSANCKTWCVTIVTALFALAIDKGKPRALLLGLIPLGLFFFLDAYYLSLEHDFRKIYNSFVAKLRAADPTAAGDVYDLSLTNNCFLQRAKATARQVGSFSILPFYVLILITLLLTYVLFNPAPPAVEKPAGGAPRTSSAVKVPDAHEC